MDAALEFADYTLKWPIGVWLDSEKGVVGPKDAKDAEDTKDAENAKNAKDAENAKDAKDAEDTSGHDGHDVSEDSYSKKYKGVAKRDKTASNTISNAEVSELKALLRAALKRLGDIADDD
ncbi:hypothetical protein BC936DRAFT_148546 [Jimgerdemannia flammicorona]|uniref:Uncharacterized protein n=1 Tax=Jimgerdemannia flammicorona TaxID=994334 RepID=A0A433DKF8_9FUNG|nr:hypothetical protein BC936DRAFT_148546 [Jimgerdemannia flammicorona]